MNDILNLVLPVFCLIGLGFLLVRTGYLPDATGDSLAAFVFKVAVPILLFQSIATASFQQTSPWIFLIVYFSAIAISWLLAMVLISKIFGRGWRASVIGGVSASFSNLVLLGIPLVERIFGQDGLQVLFFLIAFHLPVMMTAATLQLEFASRVDGVEDGAIQYRVMFGKLAHNFITNPIIVGILAGIIWRVTGLPIPGLANEVMGLVAKTTGPLALICVGMGLIKYGIKGNLAPAIGLSLLALVVMPGVAYLLGAYVFDLPKLWLQVAVLCAAAPTGVNAYLFAVHFQIAKGLATNTIVIALLGSVITVPLWLALIV